MSLGGRNAVPGCRGWFYGVRVLDIVRSQPVVEFYVYRGTEAIGPLRASGYRTTTLARKMGAKLPGYQHVAQKAIRER